MNKEDIKKQLQKDIETYIKDASNIEPYIKSMNSLNKWLDEIKK